MSKSRGNVVNPDEIVARFGADSLRLYEMFMGPLEKVKPWQTNGVDGIFRFLNRVWNMIIDREDKLDSSIQEILASEEDKKLLHRSIKKISEDLETMHLNTAISEMMIFVNQFSKNKVKPLEIVKRFYSTTLSFCSSFSRRALANDWGKRKPCLSSLAHL